MATHSPGAALLIRASKEALKIERMRLACSYYASIPPGRTRQLGGKRCKATVYNLSNKTRKEVALNIKTSSASILVPRKDPTVPRNAQTVSQAISVTQKSVSHSRAAGSPNVHTTSVNIHQHSHCQSHHITYTRLHVFFHSFSGYRWAQRRTLSYSIAEPSTKQPRNLSSPHSLRTSHNRTPS
jgi:hypothetical protein